VEADARHEPGRFVLTGSANFTLLETISQSLAGRTALATLLPLTRDEYERFPGKSLRLWEQVFKGGFPAIPDRGLEPEEWFDAYVTTYVERDVRRLLNIGDLLSFQTFLKMLAGRTGQLLNLSELGGEVGITHNTAKSWLSILEASYLTFRLPPYAENLGKRLVKTPKVYFYDTGLACFLLGIASPEQLESHPLRGGLFENWVISEILKSIVNRGHRPRLSFFRDHQGHEVDLLCDLGERTAAVEIKSGKTLASDFTKTLDWLAAQQLGPTIQHRQNILVYGGEDFQRRSKVTIYPWSRLSEIEWT
jgi:predicted AAA+ superfamily ATPase